MRITTRCSITQYFNRMNQSSISAELDPRVAFFDRHAPTWDHNGPDSAKTINRLNSLFENTGLRAGQDVLELGCGTGLYTVWLSERVAPGRVVGMDFSPQMLAQARKRDCRAEFRLADICSQRTTDDLFDAVFCFNAFPHFRDAVAALRNIRDSLRPKGIFIVLHLLGSAKLNAFHHSIPGPVAHDRLPAVSQWSVWLEPLGLGIEQLTDDDDLFLLRAQKK